MKYYLGEPYAIKEDDCGDMSEEIGEGWQFSILKHLQNAQAVFQKSYH